jgi:hypothetical protein
MGENYYVGSKTLRLCWFLIHFSFSSLRYVTCKLSTAGSFCRALVKTPDPR